jgi:hypothetical protein
LFKGRFGSVEDTKYTFGTPMEKEMAYITIVTKLEVRWGRGVKLA